MQEPGSFETTAAALSVFAHGAFIAIMLLSPGLWGIRPVQEPKTVMTITLGGGAPGPTSGGLTSEGGRPVQEMKPADEAPRPEALRPPAAKTPEKSSSATTAAAAEACERIAEDGNVIGGIGSCNERSASDSEMPREAARGSS